MLLAAGAAAAVLLAIVLFLVTRDDGTSSVGTGTDSSSTSDAASTDATSSDSSSSVTPTDVRHFLPFRNDGTLIPTVDTETTGSCFDSAHTTDRSDAFRCSSDTDLANGTNLFDPCFKGPSFDDVTVACPLELAGDRVVLLHVGTSLDSITPGAGTGSQPFGLTLSTGATCGLVSSMQPQVGDLTFPYACDDNTFASAPEGSDVLTVQNLNQDTNDIQTVPVVTAVT
jgi:hypothetical protein